MSPLGCIFKDKLSTRNTRSANSGNLCLPVPGHPESAANRLAQIWNFMNLSSAKTLGSARTLACKWYKQNDKLLN